MYSLRRLSILLLAFVFVACNYIHEDIKSTNPVSPVPTVFALPSPTPYSPPIVTPTSTPSPTIFPTRTPPPVLSGVLADKMFQKWLSGTPDCLLPCWGRVEPGKTGWEEARDTLKAVLRVDAAANTFCRFGECIASYWDYSLQDGTHYGGMLFGKEGVLYSIYLAGEYTSAINFKRLLETYGQPTQVFVQAASSARGDPPVLDAAILYPKFIVRYRWWAEVRKNNIVACGKPKFFYLGIVAVDKNQWTAEEIAANGDQSAHGGLDIWSLKPIADVTDMDVSDFYKGFVQNESGICLTTPSKYWP